LLLPGGPSEADGVFQTYLTQAHFVHYAAMLRLFDHSTG
jgi:hypothetical protein